MNRIFPRESSDDDWCEPLGEGVPLDDIPLTPGKWLRTVPVWDPDTAPKSQHPGLPPLNHPFYREMLLALRAEDAGVREDLMKLSVELDSAQDASGVSDLDETSNARGAQGSKPARNRVRTFRTTSDGNWSNDGWYAQSSLAEFCDWMTMPSWDPEVSPRTEDLPPEGHPLRESALKRKAREAALEAGKKAREAQALAEKVRTKRNLILLTTALSVAIVLIIAANEIAR
ncbi:MAG TPA: hypothetical protein VIT68_02845 [Candidatus Gracilibacteria bacterium]